MQIAFTELSFQTISEKCVTIFLVSRTNFPECLNSHFVVGNITHG